MLPISDIIIRSISGYVFIVPILILYFLYLRKSGREQSLLHIAAVFVFCYYLFGILTVAGIGYTSTISFSPKISLIPFLGMITGPIDTILNLILYALKQKNSDCLWLPLHLIFSDFHDVECRVKLAPNHIKLIWVFFFHNFLKTLFLKGLNHFFHLLKPNFFITLLSAMIKMCHF